MPWATAKFLARLEQKNIVPRTQHACRILCALALCLPLLACLAWAEPAAPDSSDSSLAPAAPAPSVPPVPPAPPVPPVPPVPWTELEAGLEYAEFDRGDATRSTLVLLRFDPAIFTFVIHSISEEGGLPLTLRQWADKHKLVAAINASMYLPDGRTSTGYMRHHRHLNSKRIVGRFGAFFVGQLYREAEAGEQGENIVPIPPHDASPNANLLDKDSDPWEEELPKYVSVVQNYRIINSQRRVLWSPGGPLYSISAVGKDGAGKILFIHCREPIEAYTFATLLLDLPIDIRTVMYVEGGAQAGLLINTSRYARLWAGRSPMDFLVTGNINAPLPNILGVVRTAQAKAPLPRPAFLTAPPKNFVGPPKEQAPAKPSEAGVPQ